MFTDRFRHCGSAFAVAIVFVGMGVEIGCASSDFEPSDRTPDAAGGSAGGAGYASDAASDAGGDPNGAGCVDSASCKSGFCVDGACCDSACDGECESCSVSGSVGSCTPHAAGTDPDAECAGLGSPTDVCAGKCSGASACEFPGAETTCGSVSCTGSTLSGEVCAGDGSCSNAETDCAPFACDGNACATSCAADADCALDGWCNAGTCETKYANGEKCGAKNQCSSGLCEGSFCCGTACTGASSCESGKCTCNGATCSSGASCELWYADNDGDGYPAPSSLDTVACSNQAPTTGGKKFYLAKSATIDCFDANASAFPGQSQFFTVHRGDGSFDYDCSGAPTKQYKEYTAGLLMPCFDCGTLTLFGCSKCTTAGQGKLASVGYECNAQCGVSVKSAFFAKVDCGKTGMLSTCSAPSSCGAISSSSTMTIQSCR